MRTFKRMFQALVLCVVAVALPPADAQNYPARPIRVVVPFPPGGAADIVARVLAQKLTELWGQQAVVENRSGAGGMIGASLVARAAPDGYTLLISSSSSQAINPHLTRKPLYDPLRDFASVILIGTSPNVLVVHPSVPARSVKELIALAKGSPGEINYASTGNGTLSHLTGELFKLQAGINMVHVPYKGGAPAAIDLVAGQVSVLFAAFPTVAGQVRAGRLRALAVTSTRRASVAPDLPTVAETLPGFESIQWWGLYAPTATPAEIVGKLNAGMQEVLRHAEVKERLAADAAEPVGGTPQELAAFLKADYDRWGKVVKQAGVLID